MEFFCCHYVCPQLQVAELKLIKMFKTLMFKGQEFWCSCKILQHWVDLKNLLTRVHVGCWEKKWMKKIDLDDTSDKCCRILILSLNLIFQDSLHWAEDCCWTLDNEALMPCFCKKTMPQQHFLYKQIGTNCCIAKFQALVFCEHYEQLTLLLMIINSWFYTDLNPGCIKMCICFSWR